MRPPSSVAKRKSVAFRLDRGRGRIIKDKHQLAASSRIARGRAGTYKSGGTRLAVATGRPVVPIAVNSARCWPRKSFLLKPGVVDVVIGKPIASVGREADELMREVEAWIEGEMRRLDPEAYAPA